MDYKNITAADFKPSDYYDIHVKDECYVCNGRVDINLSGVYTKLIQEAGRWCERFASDILYDIQSIDEWIKEWDTHNDSRKFLMGFREDGVDSAAPILYQYQEYGYAARYRYRAMWALEVRKDREENRIYYDLYRVMLP